MDDSQLSRRKFILTAVVASSVFATPRHWLPGNTVWADDAADSTLIQKAL